MNTKALKSLAATLDFFQGLALLWWVPEEQNHGDYDARVWGYGLGFRVGDEKETSISGPFLHDLRTKGKLAVTWTLKEV